MQTKEYEVRVLSASKKTPLPKFMEFDFTLEIASAQGQKAVYQTTLAVLYNDAMANSDKTVFLAIDSETGIPLKKSQFERLSLPRSQCSYYPPIDYQNFTPETWSSIKGILTTSKSIFD